MNLDEMQTTTGPIDMDAENALEAAEEQREREAAAREQQMILEAMFGTGVIKLETEVFTFGQSEGKPVWLNIRWPKGDDEEMITIRTNAHLRGLSPDAVSLADANYARGRAMIEQLAAGPFPGWLQRALTDKKVRHRVGDREIEEFRPDSSKLVSRPLVQALYLKYVETYNRFHSLGFE